MLLYRAFRIWCRGLVYKTSYAIGVESVLKYLFATEYSKVMNFWGMTEQSDINEKDNLILVRPSCNTYYMTLILHC
jgi:hypothetical protein